MPTYTIIGATGKTGGALLELLLKDPTATIHSYARSQSKLLAQSPGLDQNPRVHIFAGSLSDVELLASALSPAVDAAFMVTGMNENVPGMRLAQETAHAVVAALCRIRNSKPAYKPPRLLVLSSASMNEKIFPPSLGARIAHQAFSHVYEDLGFAEQYLRLHESWLNVIFVQPGGLTTDIQKGHQVSLSQCSPFVSYLDLAAGMIELAGTTEYDWKGVSVMATAKDVKFEKNAPPQALRGLVWHYAPQLYWASRYVRLVS